MYFDQVKDICEGVIQGYEFAIGDIFQGLRSLAVGKLRVPPWSIQRTSGLVWKILTLKPIGGDKT